MSRKDGEFPPYTKLRYHKDSPPEGWNEGARRCIECKKDWPNLPEFAPSPCCNQQCGVVGDATPEGTWRTAYAELLKFRFERYYEKWNDGASDIELCWNDNAEVSDSEISEGLEKLNALIDSLEKETYDSTKVSK